MIRNPFTLTGGLRKKRAGAQAGDAVMKYEAANLASIGHELEKHDEKVHEKIKSINLRWMR